MKSILLLTGFISILLLNNNIGQDSPFFLHDTLQIEELIIQGEIPLNDQTVMDIYRSTELSSIDKINARMPGIYTISRGAYAMEPMLNGFSSGQINVTIDGMQMFGACTDKMDPITSYIEPNNLKSIAIMHGSSGSKFGANTGGSFNMSLEEARITQLKKISAKTYLAYESVSEGKSVGATVNVSGKKWAWRINGVGKKYESYYDGQGNLVPFTQFAKLNLHNSFIYQPKPKHFFKADYLLDDAFDIGYPALPMDVSSAKARIYALEYRRLSNKMKEPHLRIKIYVNTVYHVMDDSKRDSLYFIENSNTGTIDSVYMKMDMPGWSNTVGGFFLRNIFWGTSSKLQLKLENYSHWSRAEMTMYMTNVNNPGEPPMYAETWPDNFRNVSGVYLENTWHPLSMLSFKLSTRIDIAFDKITSAYGKQQFSVFGYHIGKSNKTLTKSFHFSTEYVPSQSLTFHLKSGYNERFPTQSELYGFYLFNAYDSYDYIGNPELEIEKAWHANFGFSITQKDYQLNANGYYYFVNDYIFANRYEEVDPLNFYASGTKQYINIPHTNTYAFDAGINWQILQNLSIYNMFKYVYTLNNKNDPMPLTPPFMNILLLKWQIKSLALITETEYSSAQNRINKYYGETSTPAFMLLHFRLNYPVQVRDYHLKLSGGVENVLNKAYSEHLDWGNYNRPGRNFYLQIGLSF